MKKNELCFKCNQSEKKIISINRSTLRLKFSNFRVRFLPVITIYRVIVSAKIKYVKNEFQKRIF